MPAILRISRLSLILGMVFLYSCQNKDSSRVSPEAMVTATPTPPVNTEENRGPAVAVLDHCEGNIEVKSNRELVWNKAVPNMKLYNHDSVRTGEKSSGRIFFNDGSSLEVGARTNLIVMGRQKSEKKDVSTVAMPVGEIQSHLNSYPLETEVTVRTPRAWLRTTNRTAQGRQIQTTFKASMEADGHLRVVSENGALKILVKGRETDLNLGETLTISGPKVPDNPDDQAFNELPVVDENSFKIVGAVPVPLKKQFEVTYPSKKEITVAAEYIDIRGHMSAKTRAFVNGMEIVAGEKGGFLTRVNLNQGSNLLTFQIIDPNGKIRYQTIDVTREK